jgi:hypothetical protein
MAVGSSVLLSQQIQKRRVEERSFWKKSFLTLGIDATKWYVSTKQSAFWKIGAWLGIYSTLIGAIDALAVMQSGLSAETNNT